MKYSESIVTKSKRYYSTDHNSEILHDVLKGSNLFETTSMFRASLVLALLKLEYFVHDSIQDEALVYDKASKTFTLANNIFDIDAESREDVEALTMAYGLQNIEDYSNSQVIKDGIDHIYSLLIQGGIEIELAGTGFVTVEGNKIIAKFDDSTDPYKTLWEITERFSEDIKLAVSCYTAFLLHDYYLDFC